MTQLSLNDLLNQIKQYSNVYCDQKIDINSTFEFSKKSDTKSERKSEKINVKGNALEWAKNLASLLRHSAYKASTVGQGIDDYVEEGERLSKISTELDDLVDKFEKEWLEFYGNQKA